MFKRATIAFLALAAVLCSQRPADAYGKALEEKITKQGLNSAAVFLRVYHKASAEKILGLLFNVGLNDDQRMRVLWRSGMTRDQIFAVTSSGQAGGLKAAVKAYTDLKLDPEDVLKALCIALINEYDVRTAINFVMQREGLTEDIVNEALNLPYYGWELGTAPQGEICGKLDQLEGVDVLHLWGTPRQRGYAYGKLMAKSIMSFVNQHMLTEAMDGAVGDVPWDAICDKQYMQFDFDPAHMEEIKAMLLAMQEELSEKDRTVAKYKRTLRLSDLLCLNTAGDWAGVYGSALCTRAGDANLAGRNLDVRYDDNNEIFKRPFWLVIEPEKKAEKGLGAYATLTWPGFICGYVGFSHNGAFAMLQDGDGENLDKVHCQPRALMLRRALQKCQGAGKFPDELAAQLEKINVSRGAIIVAGGKKSRPPYVVAEVDGNHDDSKGVEFRTLSPDAGKNTLTAADLFEVRYKEEREKWYADRKAQDKNFEMPGYITESRERVKKLNDASRNREVTDVETLFAALKKAEFTGQNRVTTINAFVVDADKGVVYVKLGKTRSAGAHAVETKKFDLDKIFAR
jgi:hypothetical protein